MAWDRLEREQEQEGDKSKGGKKGGGKKNHDPRTLACFAKMNKGVCENPDCPYSHDGEFLKSTKEWQAHQNRLEQKHANTMSGSGETGKAAFVLIRAAMASAKAAKKS